jgi:hypothetical protein
MGRVDQIFLHIGRKRVEMERNHEIIRRGFSELTCAVLSVMKGSKIIELIATTARERSRSRSLLSQAIFVDER